MTLGRKATAEFIGTFWLVFGGCGTAVLAGAVVHEHGIALAFGLTVVTMAYAIGAISGCHLNPAVSIGLVAGGRMPAKDLPAYIVAQVAGAIAAAALLFFIVSGGPEGWEAVKDKGFATNGYGEASPGRYSMIAALVAEVVLTAVFIFIIHGVTSAKASPGFAGLAIGLALVLIHLISIPITNTSVNPARSTGPALFVGGTALSQLWLFWVAPIVGGIIGGVAWKTLAGKES